MVNFDINEVLLQYTNNYFPQSFYQGDKIRMIKSFKVLFLEQ